VVDGWRVVVTVVVVGVAVVWALSPHASASAAGTTTTHDPHDPTTHRIRR
jgi:hypothetical protein